MSDDWSLLAGPSEEVAPRLLGAIFTRELDGEIVSVRIVETEAYSQTDAASHSYHGRTPRTEIMFGPSGFLYVYFTYGMHYCMNVVCGPEGEGAAVLIRAVEPLSGEAVLQRHRGGRTGIERTNGPAKVCQALGIDRTYNGHDLREAPLQLQLQPLVARNAIIQTTRVGISKAQGVPWRFYIRDNPYVSRK